MGNDGAIPYKASTDGTTRLIDVAKYKLQIEKEGGKIETPENDDPTKGGPDIKPIYNREKISKVCG